MTRFPVLVLATLLCLGLASPASLAAGDAAVAPLPGAVIRGFDPPAQPWLAGHRGVDLSGEIGEPVVSALGGTVSFVGQVAGIPVLVVSHGRLRTTYQPIRAVVGVGTHVGAGQQIGTLAAGHPCGSGDCLHWGLKDGERYLDPLSVLGSAEIRLLGSQSPAQVAELVAQRRRSLAAGEGWPGLLARPVTAEVGSGFGMRFHPIFGEWRMHNGVDLGLACDSPIRAPAWGRVVRRSFDAASGHRLEIDHGLLAGHRFRTGYLHANQYLVQVGQWVKPGEVIGRVGSTGWSTGCHLHFITWLDDVPVDPQRFLPR